MRKRTQAEYLAQRVEALHAIRNLVPRGARVTIKIMGRGRDINGNTRLLVTYLCVFQGEIYCIDGYIACYYDIRTSRATKTHGSGIWEREDPTVSLARISFDLYEDYSAIKTYTMG